MSCKKILAFLILGIMISAFFLPNIFAWSLKQAPIMTQWASQVNSTNPLPEYPRPQLVRTNWLNLNGIWQFKSGNAGDPVPVGQTLSGDILVPFPVESAISGVMTHYDRLWYRRTFTVPSGWSGQRIMLNFGAVDWECEVYINGSSCGIHKGGYDPFSYDITSKLAGTGAQELIVRVYDPTNDGGNPRGKQSLNGGGGGIMYTATTGIWQTVWLEPIPQIGISNIKIVPNIDNSTVKLTVNTVGSTSGVSVSAQVKDTGTVVQTASGSPNTEMTITVPSPKLWSPENPFLYDLAISLVQNGTTMDSITSYFGMRKISLGTVGSFKKIFLNNQFVFQLGPLDQGFWPDGIYTAPTEAALKYDLEQTKALGFNMVRKHVKVEPYRWYYWADKLGLLVWQDMPSAQSYGGVNADPVQFQAELTKMIQTHWNSPCIIMWVVINEACGESVINAHTPLATIVSNVKTLDPSRLVDEASGYDWHGSGDVADSHTYPVPGANPGTSSQAIVDGEYGATKYSVGHQWGGDNGITVTTGSAFFSLYDNYTSVCRDLQTNNGLSGAVYTQLTDVETELNGLITYDRAAYKYDINQLKVSNLKAYQQYTLSYVLPTSQTQAQSWKYTTSTPASNWYTTSFSDSAWSTGNGGFGTSGTPNAVIGTTWNTSDIWLRKQFNPGTLTATDISNLVFSLYHDEDCEIYINGVQAASASGYVSNYSILSLNQAGKNAMISGGTNLIAVHCHQTGGGQNIDVGVAKMTTQGGPTPTPTPTPTTTPPSSSFSDNFNSGNANNWTTYGGTWAVSSGQYTVNADPGGKSIANNTNFSNFTYEADVSINGGDAGIIFRVSSPAVGIDSYIGYYAGLNSAGFVVLGKANNNWTQLATANMTITANTMYHMKVVTNGSNIQVFVGDMATAKINFNDSSFTTGAIGLRTCGSAAKFDNINVTTGTAPTPTSTATPTPPSSGVIFYQDSNYGGSASQVFAKGNYALSQLQAKGCPNDWMSSLKVPSGWTVIVYQDDNFGGTSWTFTTDTSFVGSACNDQMSSCKIQ